MKYKQMCKSEKNKTVTVTHLNGSEILVKLRVQRGQLVDGAVESAVMVTQYLAEEEGRKRDVHDNALSMRSYSYTLKVFRQQADN